MRVKPLRIAVWSGPRNLSTALMRSFASRGDCAVVDEPFYAAYLAASGADHPMRSEVLASQANCAAEVARQCLDGEVAQPIQYQKHMTQHMLPEFDQRFISQLTNVFLIREPERVVASFADRMGSFTREEIGFRQQAEIFHRVVDETGEIPAVVDARDVRADPAGVLQKLCQRLGIDFSTQMLSWEAGIHPDYGVWASHWYGSALRSTGFAPPDESPYPSLSGESAEIAEWARGYYDQLAEYRVR
ncbi:MAG: HAD family hydrolase [Verrucomicrobiota bacterium]